MKWINHKIITFSLVYGATGDLIGSAIAGGASIFPDLIEGKDFQSERWKKRHRTFSHWFLFWACLWFVFFLLARNILGTNIYSFFTSYKKGLYFPPFSDWFFLGISSNQHNCNFCLNKTFLSYSSFYLLRSKEPDNKKVDLLHTPRVARLGELKKTGAGGEA